MPRNITRDYVLSTWIKLTPPVVFTHAELYASFSTPITRIRWKPQHDPAAPRHPVTDAPTARVK
jgi:hypothetical protein